MKISNFKTITKNQLANALFSTSAQTPIRIGNVEFSALCSIERESGNGHTFNVVGYALGLGKITAFVTTID